MAWQTTMRTLLRVIINDIDGESFTDARLETILINSAYLVYAEIDFSTIYAIDISAETLSPDPTLDASKDDNFTYLTVLKAACIIDQGLYRTNMALSGLTAKLGPAVLQTSGHITAYKDLINIDAGPCSLYEIGRREMMFGQGNVCKAILSPFVGNSFDPRSLGGDSWTPRARKI